MKVEIPKLCPCCSSELTRVVDQLYCTNKAGCQAQNSKKAEKFLKTLKVKGFGEKTLEKLEVYDIESIYELTEDYLVSVLGDTMGVKLWKELAGIQNPKLSDFVASCSIPLMGRTTSSKLDMIINKSLADITYEDCRAVGIGDKAAQSFIDWKTGMEAAVLINKVKLRQADKVPVDKVVPSVTCSACITGKLTNYKSRSLAKEFLETLGVKVVSTLSKNTDYLVCEDGSNSSKTKKASDLGIPTVTINELKNIVRNGE